MIDPTCSFCGKSRREVSKLLAKGEAMICDECVQYCVEVLTRDQTSSPSREWLARLKRRIARAEL
jgi:ATP-dependent Clp protease ATP-binding subunit ClpX